MAGASSRSGTRGFSRTGEVAFADPVAPLPVAGLSTDAGRPEYAGCASFWLMVLLIGPPSMRTGALAGDCTSFVFTVRCADVPLYRPAGLLGHASAGGAGEVAFLAG